MDGLKPAYYTDPEELLGDFNNDESSNPPLSNPAVGINSHLIVTMIPIEMENGIRVNHLRITTEMESLTGMSMWI